MHIIYDIKEEHYHVAYVVVYNCFIVQLKLLILAYNVRKYSKSTTCALTIEGYISFRDQVDIHIWGAHVQDTAFSAVATT